MYIYIYIYRRREAVRGAHEELRARPVPELPRGLLCTIRGASTSSPIDVISLQCTIYHHHQLISASPYTVAERVSRDSKGPQFEEPRTQLLPKRKCPE